LLRVVQFGKNFTLPNVSSSLNYDFTETRSLYVSYASNARIPSIQQLAPVENRTNLQNIITLNPDLDVTQQHEIYLSFNIYDWESGNGIYAGGGLTLTQDQVGTVTLTGADLTRRTTYVNLNDGYNGWFYGSYSRTFKKDKRTFSTELGLNGNLSQNFGFTNGVEFQGNTLNLTPSSGLNRSIKDLIKLRANYDLGFNTTLYDIDSIEDQRFINHTASMDVTIYWPKNITFWLRGEYNIFGNITDEFDNDSFVIVDSLGYKFAGDKASFKLTAYDLLSQVIDTLSVVTSDFASDTSSLVLQQYFMASFTYKFSKFVKEKEKEDTVFFSD
jgi:outer membrane receptor protein involved in Fe transport